MRRFIGNTSGNVVVLVALVVPVMAGMGAIAIDVSSFYAAKNQLQSAADAGAMGAIRWLDDKTKATESAIELARKNVPPNAGMVTTADDVVFGVFDGASKTFTPTNSKINAVRVTAQRTAERGNAAPTFLGKLLGSQSADIAADAIAALVSKPNPCIYVLDENASGVFEAQGAAHVTTTKCAIQVNSASPSGAQTIGSAKVISSATCVVGGYSGSGFSPNPQTGCAKLDDPLASVPEPAQPGPCNYSKDFNTNQSQTLSPGTYCDNWHFAGNSQIALEAGLYYFKNAEIRLNSTTWSGKDVLIFLDAGSTIKLAAGKSSLNLSAAQTGPQEGIVLFQSRSANNPTLKFSGAFNLSLNGSIYTPSTTLLFSGAAGSEAHMGSVVARRLHASGAPKVTVDNPLGYSLRPGALVY